MGSNLYIKAVAGLKTATIKLKPVGKLYEKFERCWAGHKDIRVTTTALLQRVSRDLLLSQSRKDLEPNMFPKVHCSEKVP